MKLSRKNIPIQIFLRKKRWVLFWDGKMVNQSFLVIVGSMRFFCECNGTSLLAVVFHQAHENCLSPTTSVFQLFWWYRNHVGHGNPAKDIPEKVGEILFFYLVSGHGDGSNGHGVNSFYFSSPKTT